jgi:hypothetical protein
MKTLKVTTIIIIYMVTIIVINIITAMKNIKVNIRNYMKL